MSVSGVSSMYFGPFLPIFRNSRKLSAFELKCCFSDLEALRDAVGPHWRPSELPPGLRPGTRGVPPRAPLRCSEMVVEQIVVR